MVIAYTYDQAGHLTTGKDGYSYFYDYENRLTDVNDKATSNQVASYKYDHLGRRVKKIVYGEPNVVTKYCYDGDQVIAEYDDSNNLLRKFVYGQGIDEPICMIDIADSNTVYYYHFDGLGSVAALSDVNSAIVERYSYDVFGEPNRTTDVNNPYMFTGRRYDDETGLYYYRARYYDPETGRFISRDPLGYVDGLNAYIYCLNNPVNLVDPTGGCSSEIPDEVLDVIPKEVVKELLAKYGPNVVKELQKACRQHESGCGTIINCQDCGTYKCVLKLPETILAFHNCVRLAWVLCLK